MTNIVNKTCILKGLLLKIYLRQEIIMCDSLPNAIRVSSYRFNSIVLKTEQSDFVIYSFVRLMTVKNFFIQSLIENFFTLRIQSLDKDYSFEIIIREQHLFFIDSSLSCWISFALRCCAIPLRFLLFLCRWSCCQSGLSCPRTRWPPPESRSRCSSVPSRRSGLEVRSRPDDKLNYLDY